MIKYMWKNLHREAVPPPKEIKMKRKVSKIIAVVSCLILSLCLFACENVDTKNDNGSPSIGSGTESGESQTSSDGGSGNSSNEDSDNNFAGGDNNICNAQEHSYGEWQIISTATCVKEGEQRRTCVSCQHIDKIKIEPLGHDIEHHAAQEATCTQDGWKEYETCKRCAYTTYKTIPKGHSYSEEWTSDDYFHWHGATCEHTDEKSEYGYHTSENKICTVCDEQIKYTEGLEFSIYESDGVVAVNRLGIANDVDIIIPEYYMGMIVSMIGDYAFYDYDSITSVNS